MKVPKIHLDLCYNSSLKISSGQPQLVVVQNWFHEVGPQVWSIDHGFMFSFVTSPTVSDVELLIFLYN